MGSLYEKINALCAERGIKGGKMCTDLGISKGLLTDLKMGRRSGVSAKTADKIASYFGVTVGYLLGTEDRTVMSDSDTISEDDLKAAFWGGDKDLSQEDLDAMWSDVKRFAAFIAQQKRQEKQQHD